LIAAAQLVGRQHTRSGPGVQKIGRYALGIGHDERHPQPAKAAVHEFPASGQFTYIQHFLQNDPLDANDPPQKLLIPFDVAPYLKKSHW
jgi:hypothetical protein